MERDPNKNLESEVKRLPEFEPGLSPDNPQNVAAARARKLMFDNETGYYEDEDGCPTRDEYGQDLG